MFVRSSMLPEVVIPVELRQGHKIANHYGVVLLPEGRGRAPMAVSRGLLLPCCKF